MSTKVCSKCKAEKPITAFSKDRSRRDGYHPYCKACNSVLMRQHYVNNTEQRRERSRLWYVNNHERGRATRKAYAEKNRDQMLAYKREYGRMYRAAGRVLPRKYGTEQTRANYRRYAERNRERLRERGRQYRQSEEYRQYIERNRKRITERSKAWAARNREKVQATFHRKRAQRLNAPGTHTAAEWRALKAKYDNRCLCCGKQEPEITLSVDHVVPLARGGSNDISNIQPLCVLCNARKHTKAIDYRPK